MTIDNAVVRQNMQNPSQSFAQSFAAVCGSYPRSFEKDLAITSTKRTSILRSSLNHLDSSPRSEPRSHTSGRSSFDIEPEQPTPIDTPVSTVRSCRTSAQSLGGGIRFSVPMLEDTLQLAPLCFCLWSVILLPISAHTFLNDKWSGKAQWKPEDAFGESFGKIWTFFGAAGVLPFNISLGWFLGTICCSTTEFPTLLLAVSCTVCWCTGDVLIGLGGGFLGWIMALTVATFFLMYRALHRRLLLALVVWTLILQMSIAMYGFFFFAILRKTPDFLDGFLPSLIAAVYEIISVRLAHYIFKCFRGTAPIEGLTLSVLCCVQTGKAARIIGFIACAFQRTHDHGYKNKLGVARVALELAGTSLCIDLLRRLRIPHSALYWCIGHRHHVRYATQVVLNSSVKLTYLPLIVLLALTVVFSLLGENAVLNLRFWIFVNTYLMCEIVSDLLYLKIQRVLWEQQEGTSETWQETYQRVQHPMGLRFPQFLVDVVPDPLSLGTDAGDALKGLGHFSPETMSAILTICAATVAVETMLLGGVIEYAHGDWQPAWNTWTF